MTPLRPYQQQAINMFFAHPNKRLILAHATGAGKTRVALEIAKQLNAQSMLVVGSAQSRATWPKEAERWCPGLTMCPVRFGRHNNSLNDKGIAERDAAYKAPFQSISYTLLRHIDKTAPRDLVVFDEAHALRAPTSLQSSIAKAYMRAHPETPALLLTATPIPNEVMNIWNLVDTLFPGYLGPETEAGGIAWRFLNQFCQKELREWPGGQATRYFGAQTANLPRLAKKLEPIMHRVSSAEVAQYAPALNAAILWVDEPKVRDQDVAADWLEDRAGDESTHIGLFCWTHATAEKLAVVARVRGWPVTVITGHMHPEGRQMELDACAARPRACVVGTAGSLAESISLSFIKQALVFEWRATPGQAVQFSGRFARQDSKTQTPTYLLYVARTDDEREAKVLHSRLDTVAALYKQDSRATQLQEIMAPREITEDRLALLCDNMFGEVRASLSGYEGEDDDE